MEYRISNKAGWQYDFAAHSDKQLYLACQKAKLACFAWLNQHSPQPPVKVELLELEIKVYPNRVGTHFTYLKNTLEREKDEFDYHFEQSKNVYRVHKDLFAEQPKRSPKSNIIPFRGGS